MQIGTNLLDLFQLSIPILMEYYPNQGWQKFKNQADFNQLTGWLWVTPSIDQNYYSFHTVTQAVRSTFLPIKIFAESGILSVYGLSE